MRKKKQPEKVSATAMRRKFSEYFSRVIYGGESFEVYRASAKERAIISPKQENPEKGDAA